LSVTYYWLYMKGGDNVRLSKPINPCSAKASAAAFLR
jgi:hypothetical protein